jgi:hypothetical protein
MGVDRGGRQACTTFPHFWKEPTLRNGHIKKYSKLMGFLFYFFQVYSSMLNALGRSVKTFCKGLNISL